MNDRRQRVPDRMPEYAEIMPGLYILIIFYDIISDVSHMILPETAKPAAFTTPRAFSVHYFLKPRDSIKVL